MSELFDGHVPLLRPWLGEEEWSCLREVILSGWVSQGPKVAEFETAIASYVGARHAVATNACTSAIHLALRAHGVEPGDEVIMPNSTCMANANAVILAGAVPIFADIDPLTYNLDPRCVPAVIGPRTRAIMAVDQIGMPADLDALADLAKQHDLLLIDDAATALGATYKGKPLGGHGTTTTYSFHPRKMITTGEGGMLVTDHDGVAELARVMRAAGASVSDLERHKARGTVLQQYHVNGYNYRMTDIQAAIGLVQMTKLPEMLRIRRQQAAFYTEALQDVEQLLCPHVPDYAEPAFSSYLLKLHPEATITTRTIVDEMARRNVSCRYGIQPLHREPYFGPRGLHDANYPVTCDVAERTFFIPIFPGLTQQEQTHVVESLKQLLQRQR